MTYLNDLLIDDLLVKNGQKALTKLLQSSYKRGV